MTIGAYEFANATATVNITTTSVPNARRGRFYNQIIQTPGGSGTFHWMILSGNLPPGMRLDTSTGQIHGKAAVKGTWNFVIGIQDVTNMSVVASRGFTIDVKLY